MQVIGIGKDEEYPFQEIVYQRETVRVLLVDEKGRLILERITGEDLFGQRNHLETPGGGIEANEDPIIALRRECMEELGCTIKSIRELGIFIDEYNLLQRRTVSRFYSACVDQWLESRALTEEEKQYGMQLEFYDPQEALRLLNPAGKKKVEFLIYRRDYAALSAWLKEK